MDGIKSPTKVDIVHSGLATEPVLNQAKKPLSDTKAKDAAEQFESLLLSQMFTSMWQGVGKDELYGDGKEMEYYKDFYNKALSDSVAKGQGIGIKEIILKDFEKTK